MFHSQTTQRSQVFRRRYQSLPIVAWICAAVSLASCGVEDASIDKSSASDTQLPEKKTLYWNNSGRDGNYDLFRINIDGTDYQTAGIFDLTGFAVDPELDVVYANLALEGLEAFTLADFGRVQPTSSALAGVDIDLILDRGPVLNPVTKTLFWVDSDFETFPPIRRLRSVRLSDGAQTPDLAFVPPDLVDGDHGSTILDLAVDHKRNNVHVLFNVREFGANNSGHHMIVSVDMDAATLEAKPLYQAAPPNVLLSMKYNASMDTLLVVEGVEQRDEDGFEVGPPEFHMRAIDPVLGTAKVIHSNVPFTKFDVDVAADRIYYYVASSEFAFEGSIVEAQWSDLTPMRTIIDEVQEVGDFALIGKEDSISEPVAFWDTTQDVDIQDGGIFRAEPGKWGGAVSEQSVLDGESFRVRATLSSTTSEGGAPRLHVACGLADHADAGFAWSDQKSVIWARNFGDRRFAVTAFDKWQPPAGDRQVRSKRMYLTNTSTTAEFELRRENGEIRFFVGVPTITPETEQELVFDDYTPVPTSDELFPRCAIWESDFVISVIEPTE